MNNLTEIIVYSLLVLAVISSSFHPVATGLRIVISIAACLGLMIAFVAAKVGKRI